MFIKRLPSHPIPFVPWDKQSLIERFLIRKYVTIFRIDDVLVYYSGVSKNKILFYSVNGYALNPLKNSKMDSSSDCTHSVHTLTSAALCDGEGVYVI